MSKGSKQRPTDKEAYNANYDAIFRKEPNAETKAAILEAAENKATLISFDELFPEEAQIGLDFSVSGITSVTLSEEKRQKVLKDIDAHMEKYRNRK